MAGAGGGGVTFFSLPFLLCLKKIEDKDALMATCSGRVTG
jgi:hypothetical protein